MGKKKNIIRTGDVGRVGREFVMKCLCICVCTWTDECVLSVCVLC